MIKCEKNMYEAVLFLFHCLLEYSLINLIYHLVGGTEEDHGSDRSVYTLYSEIQNTNLSADPNDKTFNTVV
jgi:hypothetical protein